MNGECDKPVVKSFSFGKNWKDFIATVDDEVIVEAGNDIEEWLGTYNIRGKSIVDIGSGSGLSSLCMFQRGCRRLVSFDYDPHSVEATKLLAERVGSPGNWEIFQGSILDEALINWLGTFDIVHAWGALHHTGNMWQAIDNAIHLCAPDGLLFISLYTGGDLYEEHLDLKRRFNDADETTKRKMVQMHMERSKGSSYKTRESADGIARDQRGMTRYHDALDWLGGLPYEVAHVSEVLLFCITRGLRPVRIFERGQGGCTVYLFRNCLDQRGALGSIFEWSSYRCDTKEDRNLECQLREDLMKMCRTVQRHRAQLESLGDPRQWLKNNGRRCLGTLRRRIFPSVDEITGLRE